MSNRLETDLRVATGYIEGVATGATTCCAVTGAPGIGKTRLFLETIKRQRASYVLFDEESFPLYEFAYKHRNKDVILLKHCDAVVTECAAQMAVMKQLLGAPGTNGTRTIVRHSHTGHIAAGKDKNGVPSSYLIKAGFVWLTNHKADPKDIARKNRPLFAELLSRGLKPIRLSDDPNDLLQYILNVATEDDFALLRRIKVTLRGKHGGDRVLGPCAMNEVLAYFVDNALRLEEISLRTLMGLANLCATNPLQWRAMADAKYLSAEPLRKITLPDVPQVFVSPRRSPRTAPVITLPDLSGAVE